MWLDDDWYSSIAASSPACGRCLDRKVIPARNSEHGEKPCPICAPHTEGERCK